MIAEIFITPSLLKLHSFLCYPFSRVRSMILVPKSQERTIKSLVVSVLFRFPFRNKNLVLEKVLLCLNLDDL